MHAAHTRLTEVFTKPFNRVIILTALIFILVVIPFIAFNDLTRWDGIGHVFSAQFTADHLFPNFSGWNLLAFSGFGQNYFYPPVFYWVSALLGQVVSVELAIKLLLAISFLLIPYSAYFLAKKFHLSDEKASWYSLFLTAIWLLPNRWFEVGGLGGTLASTLNVGLYPNGFIFPIVLFTLGIIREGLETKKWKLAGTLIAICLLTHYIGALLIFFLVVLTTYSKFRKEWKTTILMIATAVLLSLFWLIKGALFQSEWFSVPITRLDGIGFVAFFAISILLMIWRSIKREQNETDWVFVISLAVLAFAYLFFAPIHYYRFLIPLSVFGLLMLTNSLNEKQMWKVGTVAVVLMIVGMSSIDFLGENKIELNSTITPERVMFTSSSTPREYYHFPRYWLQEQNVEVAKGLFVESSRMSRYYSVLETEINPDAFIWGDYPYQLIIDTKKLSWPLVAQQLDTLGISSIITDRNDLDSNGKKELFATHYFAAKQDLLSDLMNGRKMESILYYRYELKQSSLSEIISQPIFYPDQNTFNQMASQLFFTPNAPTIILTKPFELATPQTTVATKLVKKSNEELELVIDSDQPALVQVKYTYFPNWHAYQDGKEIPIYISSPRFMTVYAKGNVTFKFESSIIENASFILSALFLIGLVGLAVVEKNRKKKE